MCFASAVPSHPVCQRGTSTYTTNLNGNLVTGKIKNIAKVFRESLTLALGDALALMGGNQACEP